MKHLKVKKLTLNKVTIAGLNGNAMSNVHGGAFNDDTGTSGGAVTNNCPRGNSERNCHSDYRYGCPEPNSYTSCPEFGTDNRRICGN